MALQPSVVPNPRHDLLVSAPDGTALRHTVYSGRLLFGAPAARGTMMSRMDFDGGMFLPDSLPYIGASLGGATLSVDCWVQSVGEYLFVPHCEARFVDDPRQPGVVWVQLGLAVQGYSGSIVGYRVTVSADPDAIQAS